MKYHTVPNFPLFYLLNLLWGCYRYGWTWILGGRSPEPRLLPSRLVESEADARAAAMQEWADRFQDSEVAWRTILVPLVTMRYR